MKYGEVLEQMLLDNHRFPSKHSVLGSVLGRYLYRLDESDGQFLDDPNWWGSMREAGAFQEAWDDVEEWYEKGSALIYEDIDYKAFKSWKKRFTLKVGWHTDGTWSSNWCFKHKGKKYNFNWPSLNEEVEVTP